jgi:hypothetical protein
MKTSRNLMRKWESINEDKVDLGIQGPLVASLLKGAKEKLLHCQIL